MKTIVIPVDFSTAAENAARYAAHFAKAFNAELHLLNVYHIPNPLKTLPIELIVTLDELDEATHSKLKALKFQLEKEVSNCPPIRLASRNGKTAKEIDLYCNFIHADMIMLGSKRKGESGISLLGSTAVELIGKTSYPVLMIPETAVFNVPKEIVITLDGKNHSVERGMELIRTIAERFDAKLVLEHFIINGATEDRTAMIEQQEPLFAGVKHSYSFHATDDVTSSLEDLSCAPSTGILVMMPNPHTLFERIGGRDHARRLAVSSGSPLLFLRH